MVIGIFRQWRTLILEQNHLKASYSGLSSSYCLFFLSEGQRMSPNMFSCLDIICKTSGKKTSTTLKASFQHVRPKQNLLLPCFSLARLFSLVRICFHIKDRSVQHCIVCSSVNTLWIKCDPDDNIDITDGLAVFITRCLTLFEG